MIFRRSPGRIESFEKKTGMTAVFTGEELRKIDAWAAGGTKTPFISRLFTQGVFFGQDARAKLRGARAPESCQPMPRALHIDITDICPLACRSCYRGCAGKESGKEKGEEGQHMEKALFQRLIEEAETLRIFQIAIGGGEPLCHPHLEDCIRAVARTQMAVSLTTSGSGLDAARLSALQNAGITHLQVSLNGADHATNAASRDGFHGAQRALLLLSKSGISFGINWVARKDNLDGFAGMLALARSLGADNLNVLRYKPSPAEDYHAQALDAAGFFLLAAKIREGLAKGVRIKLDSAWSPLLLYINHGRTNPENHGCAAGRSFIAVLPDGRFKPCSHLDMAEQATGIADFCASKTLRDFRERQINGISGGDCGTCPHIPLCGGCRAICEKTGAGLFSGETACPTRFEKFERFADCGWRARDDSNVRPLPSEGSTLSS